MDKIKERISIVFPVYNEESVIETTISSYYDEFNNKLKFEMIVKEDGSTDDTKKILKKLAKKYPIRLFMSDTRKGYQWSVMEAIKHARYEWVFLVDSDYQYRAYDFWKLIPYAGRYDIILGRRVKRMDMWHRILMSKVFNFLIRILFHIPYKDVEPGYRLIRKEVLDRIVPNIQYLSYLTSELVIRAHDIGYKIIEVPVDHFKRKEGTTHVFKFHKLPVIILKEFIGLFKLKYELMHNRKINMKASARTSQ